MPKLCVTDENGEAIAFYDTEVHTAEQIPDGAFPIIDAIHRESIENPGARTISNDGGTPSIQAVTRRRAPGRSARERLDAKLADPFVSELVDMMVEGVTSRADALARLEAALED